MVRRDASHNVKFMVQSPMVKFIPLDSGFIEEFLQYTVPSGTLVSKHQLENLFKQIQDQGFFDLNANYKSNIDDNSMLENTVEGAGKKKAVFSGDFKNSYPKVLTLIENEVVLTQGKNLKSVLLSN